MQRRTFLGLTAAATTAGLFAADRLAAQGIDPVPGRSDQGALVVTAVEPIVIRTPKDDIAHEAVIEMPPIGATTPGVGTWRRLDIASPSRYRGYEQATVVKITTAGGLVGWGECHAPTAPRMHKRIIEDLLGPIVVGHDARDIEALWARMYASERVRGYQTGAHLEAIAGVDLALWDLLGKWAGAPVYQLLGGKFRDRIPTYATFSSTYTGRGDSTPVVERARRMVEAGFPVVKTALRAGPDSAVFRTIAEVAAAIAPNASLAVDSLGAFSFTEAQRVGRELDAIGNIAWFEDPLVPEQTDRYGALGRSFDTPLCAGEALSNRYQFRDLVAGRGVALVNPDVCRAGGLTECRRIAVLADVYGVLLAPHVSTGSGPYLAASIHLGVASPNCAMMEVYDGMKHLGPFGNVLLHTPLDLGPGYAAVPERPGLGADFNEHRLEDVRVS
jgi:D-galactarolactone cycloisomerase